MRKSKRTAKGPNCFRTKAEISAARPVEVIRHCQEYLLLFKYDTDLGAMLIEGLIRTAIWAVAFIGGACLVETDSLIYKILLWPAVK